MKFLIFFAFALAIFHSCYTTQNERNKFEPSSTDSMVMEPPQSNAQQTDWGDSTTMVVLKDGLLVRERPESTSKIIKKLKKWDEVLVIGTKNGWSKLESGWVESSELGE